MLKIVILFPSQNVFVANLPFYSRTPYFFPPHTPKCQRKSNMIYYVFLLPIQNITAYMRLKIEECNRI